MLDSFDEDTLGIMSSFKGNLGRFGPHVAHRKNAGKLARKCPLAPLAQNALLYAVCGDDIHAHIRVATRFFADRHVGEKLFRLFGLCVPCAQKYAESSARAGVLSHIPLDAA